MLLLFVPLIALFVAMNLFTMLMFRQDKRHAVAGERRIAEANLLALAAFGGSPGALIARRMFRHKTRKQPFSTWLYLIVALQAGAAIGFAVA
jgi:uncharacterized membrane protein YsdA (DUF1294 family)